MTGGTGKAGHWIVKHLLERGYDVVNVDVRHPERPECKSLTADLTDLGQTIDAFNVKDFRAELQGRTALISNRRAKELLGWKQEFYLR